MILAHVSRQQTPSIGQTPLTDGDQNNLSPSLVHFLRLLVHLPFFGQNPLWICLDEAAPRQIMRSVNRTGLVAMDMAPITRESNQVSHGLSVRL